MYALLLRGLDALTVFGALSLFFILPAFVLAGRRGNEWPFRCVQAALASLGTFVFVAKLASLSGGMTPESAPVLTWVIAILLSSFGLRRWSPRTDILDTSRSPLSLPWILLLALVVRLIHPLNAGFLGQSDAYSHLQFLRDVVHEGQLAHTLYPDAFHRVLALPVSLLNLDPYLVARYAGAWWGVLLVLLAYVSLKSAGTRSALAAAWLLAACPLFYPLIKTGVGSFPNQAGLVFLLGSLLALSSFRRLWFVGLASIWGLALTVPLMLAAPALVALLDQFALRARRDALSRYSALLLAGVAVAVFAGSFAFLALASRIDLSHTVQMFTGIGELSPQPLPLYKAMVADYFGIKRGGVGFGIGFAACMILGGFFASVWRLAQSRGFSSLRIVAVWGLLATVQSTLGVMQFTAYQRAGWELLLALALAGGPLLVLCADWLARKPGARPAIRVLVAIVTLAGLLASPRHQPLLSGAEEDIVAAARGLSRLISAERGLPMPFSFEDPLELLPDSLAGQSAPRRIFYRQFSGFTHGDPLKSAFEQRRLGDLSPMGEASRIPDFVAYYSPQYVLVDRGAVSGSWLMRTLFPNRVSEVEDARQRFVQVNSALEHWVEAQPAQGLRVDKHVLGQLDVYVVDVPDPDHSERLAGEQVESAYRIELHRAPDSSGMSTYAPMLASGELDKEGLRCLLRDSPEGRALVVPSGRMLRVLAIFSIAWIAMFLMPLGLGLALVRWGRSRFGAGWGGGEVFSTFWIGVGFLVLLLQFWSLFFPVDSACLIGSVVLGLLGWAYGFREFRTFAISWSPLRGMAVILFALALATVAAAKSARVGITAYDTLLFHLSSVEWMNQFAAVPGLANLHIRLGTNSGYLLLSSLMDQGFFDTRSAWFMPGFVDMLFVLNLLYAVFLSPRHGGRSRLFALLLIPYGLSQMGSLSPNLYFDAPTQMLLGLLLLEMVRLTEPRRDQQNGESKWTPSGVLYTLSLATLAFSFKPIGAPMLLVVLLALGIWLLHQFKLRAVSRRSLIIPALPLLVLAGWMLRNAILSGWLMFPSPHGELPVDWAVPAHTKAIHHDELMQTVEGQRSVIQAWARRPGAEFVQAMNAPLNAWFFQWVERNLHSFELPRLVPLTAAFFLIWILGVALLRKRESWQAWALPVLMLTQLAFWFFAAPDLRFGRGLIWMTFALSGAYLFSLPSRLVYRELAGAVALVLTLYLSLPHLPALVKTPFNSPWLIGRAPALPTRIVQLDGGQHPPLEVHVPVRGDQAGNAPLPNTPYPRSALQARKPGDLSKGFRVGGD